MAATPRQQAKDLGLPRYFTGKPCKHGHVANRTTRDGHCVECGYEKCRRYFRDNREKVAIRQRVWVAANPDRVRSFRRSIKQNYRARKVAAEGIHTAADIAALFDQQRGKCAYFQICGKKLPKRGFHVDHILPLSLNGSNWRSNLQLTCQGCNCSKQGRHPIDFSRARGMLL